MAKKFDSSKIVVKACNIKPEKASEVYNFTRFLVYRKVAENAENAMKNEIKIIEKTLINANWKTVSKDELLKIKEFDAISFLSKRDVWEDARNELNKLEKLSVNDESYNAIQKTDKVFLTLQAHTAISSINLESYILDSDKKDDSGKPVKYDFSNIIESFYKQGKMGEIKQNLINIFRQIVSFEGSLFYGVKLRKSNFTDKDIREFLASFGGKAKRTSTVKGSNKIYGNYEWIENYNEKAVLTALTTLFAVVTERTGENGVEVIKPEPEKDNK